MNLDELIKSNPNGVDFSAYQGDVNYETLASKVDFALFRCSFGLNKDSRFIQNWMGCAASNVPFHAYHAFYPQYNWDDQVDNFVSRVKSLSAAHASLFPVIDSEVSGGVAPALITEYTKNWILSVEDALGLPVIVYTRKSWWDTYTILNSWAYKQPLWIANYIAPSEYDNVSTPAIPRDWEIKNVGAILWQYSKNGNGKEYGMTGLSVDLNVSMLSYLEFKNLFNISQIPDPAPVALKPCIMEAVKKVNIRTGPGMNFTDVGDLLPGQKIAVYDVSSSSSAWVKAVDMNGQPIGWVAKTYSGTNFLKKVED